MSVDVFGLHLLNLAHGISVAVVCVGLFGVCGLAIAPPWLRRTQPGRLDGQAAVLGAATFVLVCWFGVRWRVPLNTTIPAYAACVVLLAIIRFRRVRDAVSAAGWWRSTLTWFVGFAGLYTLCYLFLPPPVTPEYLPFSRNDNLDFFSYLEFSRYLQTLGASNVAAYSFLGNVYHQTPASFYVLPLFALAFDGEPVLASMPVLFSAAALCGILMAQITASAFSIPRRWALAVAAVVLSGPLFRYVLHCYYLSTLLSLPIFLHLLWTTATIRPERGLGRETWLTFLAHDVLLLLIYPTLLVAGVLAQVATIGLRELAHILDASPKRPAWWAAARHAGRLALAMAVASGVLLVAMPGHVIWTLEMIGYLGRGEIGWPLDLISPLSLLGVPSAMKTVSIPGPAFRLPALLAMAALATTLAAVAYGRLRATLSPVARTFVGLFAGAVLAYGVYFQIRGVTYQQWKFATYFPLPLSFVFWAVCLKSCGIRAGEAGTRQPKWGQIVAGVVTLALVGGNVWMRGADHPPLKMKASVARLASIDQMAGFRDVDVTMASTAEAMMAVYYIRAKTVYLTNDTYYPHFAVDVERTSPRRPHLIQGLSCEGVGHADTTAIAGVGCLLFAPPSLARDTTYSFGRTQLFAELAGTSLREEWGRWNARQRVSVTLTADVVRVRTDTPLFVNVRVVPHPLPGRPRRHVDLTWGNGHQASVDLGERTWLSFPVNASDWVGGARLRKTSVSFHLPDAVQLRLLDPASRENRPIALGFELWNVSPEPRGFLMVPQSSLPRGRAHEALPRGVDTAASMP